MTGWIFLGGFVLLAGLVSGYGIIVYNGFIALKNNIDKAWSNIDILLKQRFDELPKLIKVCEGYMQHERNTLEAVIQARSRVASAGSDQDRRQAQNQLSETLRSLFMVVERYPELKADLAFRSLASRISELEDQIADRREFYNDSVNVYNIRRELFPEVLVARLFAFAARTLWQIDPAERQDVAVAFRHE